ncbi:MAG: M1 family aminopeptidase [Bacteroidota bacterium]
MSRVVAIFLFLGLFSLAGAQVFHSCPHQAYAADVYENPLYKKWLSAYDIKHYNLLLHVSNKDTEISGSARIILEATRAMDTLVFELQDALDISKIYISEDIYDTLFNTQLSFLHENDAVYIQLDRQYVQEEDFAIVILYGGEAGQNRGFFAGISNASDPDYGFDVTYTLSEPHNARDWFPVKQVLEDQIDSVRIRLVCDKSLMAASNGTLMEIEERDRNTHMFTWKTNYPMAYYLLSFAVADYQDLSFKAGLSGEGDSVLVQNYIYNSEDVLGDWEEEILETGSMITSFSKLLMDYPFAGEKYGHAMAPMGGGMEHQTMTTIHDFGFYLVAHELAHQWFGDYITCGNWQDIWINEGFASYLEYIAAQELRDQDAADGWMANAMSIALGETEGSVYVPVNEVNNTYRLFDYGLTYKKGAILLHMIRYHLDDDEVFFRVLRSYLHQYGNGLATGDDFRQILETESGMDFSCFFDQWYYGEGFPRFAIHWNQSGDSLKVRSEQTSTAPAITPFFNTPFDLEIYYLDGTQERVRLIQDEAVEDYGLETSGLVKNLVFDPDNYILNSSSVIHQLPPDRFFTYGPNPVTDEFYIQFINTTHIDEILITNLSGQEVLRFEDMENPVQMNLSGLADGTYVVLMNNASRTYKERIVKISGE